jgi:hypothetical protein
MPDQPANPAKPNQDSSSEQVTETHLDSVGEFSVEHLDSPPPAAPNQRIHPRRPLPLVPGARRGTNNESKDEI